MWSKNFMVRWVVILTILFFQLGAFEASARDFTFQTDFNGDYSRVITAEGEEGIKGTIGVILPPSYGESYREGDNQPNSKGSQPKICWFNVNHFDSTQRCFKQVDEYSEFSTKYFLAHLSEESLYEKAFQSALVFALSHPKYEFSRQWSQSSRFQQDVYAMLEELTLVRAAGMF